MSSSHTSQNETNGVPSDDSQLLVATVQDSLSLLSLDSNVPIAATADPLAEGHNSDPATQPLSAERDLRTHFPTFIEILTPLPTLCSNFP